MSFFCPSWFLVSEAHCWGSGGGSHLPLGLLCRQSSLPPAPSHPPPTHTTHSGTHKLTLILIHIHTHTHTHIHTHIHIHTHTHIHMHTHAPLCSHTLLDAHIHAHTCSYTYSQEHVKSAVYEIILDCSYV